MFRLKFSKLLAVVSALAIISVFIPTPLPVFALDTGYKSPAGQAAGPGGHGNGFETTPTNAFADGGGVAFDLDSGTLGSLVCTDPNRDKHDFYNYSLGVPSGSTINGIEVRLDAFVDLVKNSAALCAQLSWDGGATWTAAKTTPGLTTTEATYILGGATDTWGRTWTSTELADVNFRVRIINIATAVVRDFSLDWAAVKVYYNGTSATATHTTTGPTNTPQPPTNTPLPTNTSTVGPSPTPTRTNTVAPPTNTPTNTVVAPTPTKTNTPGLTNTPSAGSNPITIYGVWHCSNDYCIWGAPRTIAEFDSQNHWVIDRGDGSGLPSVNMVILSFVEPLKLLNQTTDATTLNGVPRGFTPEIVNYFKSRGIRVMASIGGITYVTPWNTALTQNGYQLGLNAAAMATNLGIGVEIDWEENAPSAAEMAGLQAFVDAYRSVHPYDATGNDHTARLTIDLAAGDRWLIDITTKATTDWLKTVNAGTPVLDYANAMVSRGDGTPSTWQEHVDGKPQYDPPIPPLAPAKFTGGLWLHGNNAACTNFASSPQKADANYVQTVAPNGAGTTNGMLGFMFWAAECEGTRSTCTTPPNTCEGGMGVAAKTFNIPLPIPALRQQ
jgi:hypothetical protein